MSKINELRDYLLENYVDGDGDLNIRGLDFSKFNGDIYVSEMKVKGDLFQSEHNVKGDLYQSWHEVNGNLSQGRHDVGGNLSQGRHDVGGNLIQSWHDVKGNLSQDWHDVGGNLSQSHQDVKGNYSSVNISVTGEITFEEPRKVLKEMGYEIERVRIKVDEVSGEAKAFANLLGIDGFCGSCEMEVAKPEKFCKSCGVELEWEQDE